MTDAEVMAETGTDNDEKYRNQGEIASRALFDHEVIVIESKCSLMNEGVCINAAAQSVATRLVQGTRTQARTAHAMKLQHFGNTNVQLKTWIT